MDTEGDYGTDHIMKPESQMFPAVLLELLSHQNLADQKFGLDPRFRFQVSRSVYKGILKYLSYVENREYDCSASAGYRLCNCALIGKKRQTFMGTGDRINMNHLQSLTDTYFTNGLVTTVLITEHIIDSTSVETELEFI